MIKTPPFLKKGDTIGIVCPAGYMAREKVEACVQTLSSWGYHVRLGKTVGSSGSLYMSGTDDERAGDLQAMLDDDNISAIMCARGGYGVTRIIDTLDFSNFRKKPKWIIGFSDVTVLHSHVYTNLKISTLHAPMASAFNDQDKENKYLLSLRKALEGEKIHYECPSHAFNRKGEAIGELVGGNLALLAHCIGTPSDIKTRGKILFIEDVGEYLYNIDRMMRQLKRAGKFDKLAGLIVGGFTGCKDTERPFGKTAEEIIRDVTEEFSFPVCFGFPVSHERENLALRIGEGYKLKVGKGKVMLEE